MLAEVAVEEPWEAVVEVAAWAALVVAQVWYTVGASCDAATPLASMLGKDRYMAMAVLRLDSWRGSPGVGSQWLDTVLAMPPHWPEPWTFQPQLLWAPEWP